MMLKSFSGNSHTEKITKAAAVAAVYVLLTIVFMPFGFGPVQVRISEALCVLSAFVPNAWAGLTLGCLISNIIGGAPVPDIVLGSFATFLGAFVSRKLYLKYSDRGSLAIRLIAACPSIVSNTLILPFVFKYAYGMNEGLWLMTGSVLLGEVISVGIIGNILMTVLNGKR